MAQQAQCVESSPLVQEVAGTAPAPQVASPQSLRQLLEAHRHYIAEAVSALDMHTTLEAEYVFMYPN